jgi:exopolysaccharide production protein ExoZ
MTDRNHSLDLLRGIAILLVVVAHCAAVTTSFIPRLAPVLANEAQIGVQLFFIVSGYTMMLTYGDESGFAAARSFYIRRVFRIAPAFWVAILFYLSITKGEGAQAWAPDGISARDVLLTAFFLHGYSLTAFNSVVPGGWSIAVEMQFYLLFPLIISIFRRPNGALLCCALIALVNVAGQFVADRYLIPWMTAVLPPSQAYLINGFFYCWLPRQLICFGFGILLYDWVERKSQSSLGAMFLVGATLLTSWGAFVAVMAAASFAVLASKLTMPVLGLLGRHSYAIYLAHFAVISVIQALHPLDLVPMTILVTALSLALSYYLFEPLLERPCNRFGHVLASNLGRRKPAIA